MATPTSVFGSPENLKAAGESIAKSMAAQSIAGVNGSVDPKMAASICNVIRAQDHMINTAVYMISAYGKWIRRLLAIIFILTVALVCAIMV